MTKSVSYPGIGEVTFCKRRGIRNVTVSYRPGRGVRVSYPWYVLFSQAERVLMENMERLKAVVERAAEQQGDSPAAVSAEEIERLRRAAKFELPQRAAELAELASRYSGRDLRFNRICIKNNRSNWGSCSTKRNINLNLHLMALPENLRDYVILHELCHIVYQNHGREFHEMLGSLCLNILGREGSCFAKELRMYRL